MKLPYSLLKERLLINYPQLTGNNVFKNTVYSRPILYEASSQLLPNHIYLIEDRFLFTSVIPPSALLLFSGNVEPESDYRDSISYITLNSSDSPVHIFNILQGIFDEYDLWEQSLSQALLNGNSIQQILSLAYPLLGCPLCLLSRGFSMIAFVGQDLLPKEQQIFDDPDRTIEYINAMKQNDFYNKSQNFDAPYIFPDKLTGIRSWNVNIQQLGHTTHRLMMLEYPRSFTESDAYLLNILASYIRYLLYHDNDVQLSGENSMHSIFLSILSDSTTDYIETSQHLSLLGWTSSHSYMALVMRITFFDQQNMTTNAICSYVEELFPDSCCLPYKKDIVAFFNLTLLDMDEETVSEKLTVFIRDSFFKAGYSRSMHGHMNLRRQYIQACVALDVGCRHKPHIWIHHFNQIVLYYLLEQASRQLPAYMLCHEALLHLKAIDDTQNTNYLETLRTYLNNHLNAVQSAKDLFIHRSTFLYRLEKIKSILETDFDDPDEILYLLLSYRLLDLEESQE